MKHVIIVLVTQIVVILMSCSTLSQWKQYNLNLITINNPSLCHIIDSIGEKEKGYTYAVVCQESNNELYMVFVHVFGYEDIAQIVTGKNRVMGCFSLHGNKFFFLNLNVPPSHLRDIIVVQKEKISISHRMPLPDNTSFVYKENIAFKYVKEIFVQMGIDEGIGNSRH